MHAVRAVLMLVVGGLVTAVGTGCGGGSSKVTGKVTYKDKPVVWGTVILVDKDGIFHQGDIDLSGNYVIDKVPNGPVKIGVSSPNPFGGRDRDLKGAGGVKPVGGSSGGPDPRADFLKSQGKAADSQSRPLPPAGSWVELPANVIDPETSQIKGEVKSGESLNIVIP